jgi:hypothetical protein
MLNVVVHRSKSSRTITFINGITNCITERHLQIQKIRHTTNPGIPLADNLVISSYTVNDLHEELPKPVKHAD